jgi:membrane protein DedA with SNARE-associated domain
VIHGILEALGRFIIGVISSLGYGGVVVCMAIESACIPLPSEIIMPFSGYLASTGRFSLFWVSMAGAFGCVVGSVAAYYLGMYAGRGFIERYGRWVLVTRHDLDLADRWFAKYGHAAIFVSRLLPVVRTFISFPAGVARMPIVPFIIYTFLGSLPFCWFLAWIGKVLGENWPTLRKYFHGADLVIGALILIGGVYWVWRHVKILRMEARERAARENP